MTFLEETKSFIEKLQSSIAVDSDNSLLLDVAIGKFIALNEWSDIDRIEAKEIDKHLIKLQIKLESKRRDNDLIFHPYEEISKLIALASIENISDSAALGIANNLIYQCSSQSITIPSYIHEVIDDSIRELITKFKKPLQTTRAAASTISTEAHELAESLLCNDENNIYTNAYDEYLILLCEKRNTILNDLRKAFKSNEVGDNEILRKIKDFTNINLMVYEEDANNQAILNRYKSDLEHNSLFGELTNDFENLYLEGKIDHLRRIENILSNELNELKDHHNMGVSFWERRLKIEKNESYSKNIDYYKTILDYKSDYIDEALSALNKFTNSITDKQQMQVSLKQESKANKSNEVQEAEEINEQTTPNLTAKHYALEYIFDCYIKGIHPPIGRKKELEKIGNKRMGVGRGNTFYKACNDFANCDINDERNILDLCGDDWKEAVLHISKTPKELNEYLKTKRF